MTELGLGLGQGLGMELRLGSEPEFGFGLRSELLKRTEFDLFDSVVYQFTFGN